MQLQFLCTQWGSEHLDANEFMDKVVSEGYDGIEINLPENDNYTATILNRISEIRKSKTFVFVAQQVLAPAIESAAEYKKRFTERLQFLLDLNPDFINSHTGKDYYSFDTNYDLIEKAEKLRTQTGIPNIHETHRGRFSFHLASILPYLKEFPQLQLAADLSHWCNVSESLLADQQLLLKQVIPHFTHIHARVGYEHGPQVNDPRAPEWQNYLDTFIAYWKKILAFHKANGKKMFTILTEFGPVPYMPTAPFTNHPLAEQWEVNVFMKDLLGKELNFE